MNKQLQFELWEECNSHCKFCYLGKENRCTPNRLKINACKNALKMISDMSFYPEYNTLAYLGGEFFQGQLNDKDVKEAFMTLMKKTAELLNAEIVEKVWIYATLTIGDQKDLYETLKLFENHKGELWILTSYDTIGRFHTKKMEDNWSYHMKKIHELYPEIKFNITTILSGDCIDKYLSGELSFKKMMEEYHTEFFFKQPSTGGLHPAEFNEKVLPNFAPTRHKFLQFLRKFKAEESDLMWDKLFNIKYRADLLYRNGNTDEQQMQENVRHKDSKVEVSLNFKSPETDTAKCGHLIAYTAYADSDGCVLCDKHMIEDLTNNG